MKTQNKNITSLSELEDKVIGKSGTPDRDKYEFDLQMEILGEIIKTIRIERKLTQEQLGELIGVQKSTISKLENKASNITINTLLKTFKALKTDIKLQLDLRGEKINIA